MAPLILCYFQSKRLLTAKSNDTILYNKWDNNPGNTTLFYSIGVNPAFSVISSLFRYKKGIYTNRSGQMSTKSKLLELLEQNRGKNISGEEIAKLLQISRTAVWKAVKALEREGYRIKAVSNKGYTLSQDSNILSVQGILPFLSSQQDGGHIHVFESLASTNQTAKEMAIAGHEHGTVVISNTQTSGRGRYGRVFYSPSGTGLYMSFLLRTAGAFSSNPTLITTSAAVAVCRAVQALSGKELRIKWVNDLFWNDKKVCGILTEAMTDFESGNIEWAVIGIGVNISALEEGFPPELAQTAGCLFPEGAAGTTRNQLAAGIIDRLLSLESWESDSGIYAEYKNRSLLLGKEISVSQQGDTYTASAMDIDASGHLVVQKDTGEIVQISSGEVQIVNYNINNG